ncbi:MAG TPA: YfhO family protein, partial [Planctomycetota bacterium]|nr:YfhO family protein [Planctomycetota bacterium]
ARGADPDAWAAQLPAELAARFEVTRTFVEDLLDRRELARAALRVRESGCTLALFAALGALMTAWIAFARKKTSFAPAWLCLFALVAVEGSWYARPHLAPRSVEGPLFPPSASMDALRAAAGDGRVLRLDESESGVGDVLELARPDLPQAYGIADLSPYVVFTPRSAVELWSAADPRSVWRNGVSRISDVRLLDHPVLDVLRVTAIVARRPLDHPRLEPVLVRDGFCVYRRSGVPARARVVTSTIAASGLVSALEIHAARQADPARQTVLPAGAPAWNPVGEGPRGSVATLDVSNSAVTVRTHETPRGWLVLADAWAPGWRASVDGRPADVLAVDHALRGVALEAGSHEIAFTYAPAALRLGALLSAVALAAVIALGLRARAAPPVS